MRERERESAHARERRSDERDLAVGRNLAFARSCRREIREEDPSRKIARSERKIRRSRSRLREIAPLIAISRQQDQAVDRDLARREIREEEFELCLSFFWVVFSFFFSKHQKIFSGKFFEMQPNKWKYFPFPKISISGKYVF